MEFDLISIQGLFCCLAYFFAGIVDSVCGGGGLITIPTLMMTGIPPHAITGTNQCSACLGAWVAAYKYMKSGKIHFFSAWITLPFAILGCYLGARLNLLVPEAILKIFMLAMIPIIALFLFLNKASGEADLVEEQSKGRIVLGSVLIGLILGGYQGFYGPGGGMFFMLAYAAFLKLSLVRATANTRLVLGIASVSSTLAYAASGTVLWKLAAAATIFNIVGSYLGAGLAIKRGSKIIRPMMFVIVALLVVKLVVDMV